MKQGWEIKKLGEVCYFQNGFAFKSNTFTDRGEPILRISDIQNDEIIESKMVFFNPKSYPEDLSRFLVYPNDIVIAMSGGTTGKIGINKTNKTFYLNQRVGVFRENPNLLNHQYLYYFLKTKSEESLNLAAGAAQPNLSTVQINAFEIPTPSLAEQERIVEILDKEFERIDALKANAERNLQHAKDLLIQSQNAAFDSEDIRPLDSVVSIINGYAFKSEDFNKTNPIKAVKITNVGVGVFVETDDTNLPQKLQSEKQDYVVHTGDIVFALTRTIIADGLKVAIVPETYNCALLNQRVASLRIDDAIQRDYLYNYFQSTKVRRYVLNRVNVLMQPNLSIKDLKAMPIPYCGKIEMEKIVARLNKLKEHCKTLEENYTKTIALCDDMKQALLRKAFNGEL